MNRTFASPVGALTIRWIIALALLASLKPALLRADTPVAAKPQVEFLDLKAAKAAIVDESMEPYFKLLQPIEMTAKTAKPITGDTIEAMRDECRRRYEAAVQEFTPQEKDLLVWYVTNLQPLVARDYPGYAKTPWSFIKLSSDFEGGMPHTRGSHIVLSDSILRPMVVRGRGAAGLEIAQAQYADTLLHEQSHVVQREHPQRFVPLYTKKWGLKHADKIDKGDWITQHEIVNPDGVDDRWVFPIKKGDQTRWIWPLIVLNDEATAQNATFASMRMVAVDIEPAKGNGFKVKSDSAGKPQMRDLMQEAQYVQVFAPSMNIYHPNEAEADLFARITIIENLLPSKTPEDAERARRFKEHFAPLMEAFHNALTPTAAPKSGKP